MKTSNVRLAIFAKVEDPVWGFIYHHISGGVRLVITEDVREVVESNLEAGVEMHVRGGFG